MFSKQRTVFFLLAWLICPAFCMGQGDTKANSAKFVNSAPKSCLVYSFWNGAVDYEKIDNATSKLMLEPEVKAFVDDISKRIGLLLPALDNGKSADKTELLHSLGPQLVDTVLSKAGCYYVESFEFDERGQPKLNDLNAAMLLDAGSEASSLAQSIVSIMAGDKAKTGVIDGGKFFQIPIEDAGSILVGSFEQTLIVATNTPTARGAIQRLASKNAPAWIQKLESNSNIAQVKGLSFINFAAIRQKLAAQLPGEARSVIDSLGFGNVEWLETCSGLGQEGWISRMFIKVDGRPEGVLDLAGVNGLSANDINNFPSDSLFAVGLSVDPRRATTLFDAMVQLSTNGRSNLDELFDEIREEVGIDIRNEFINNLGTSWTIYNGAGDGWLAGTTLTTSVKDANAVREVSNKLIKSALMSSQRSRTRPPVFRQRNVGEQTITSFQARSIIFPIEFSWCITDDQLIFGLFPQAIESALKRDEGQSLSLTDNKFLNRSFVKSAEDSKLVGMAYIDTATNFEITYSYLPMVLGTSSMTMDQAFRGMDQRPAAQLKELVSGIRLPRSRVIHQHLEPTWLAVRQTSAGIELESVQTLPGLDPGMIVPMGAAALLPAIQSTRTAARRVQSANNLRQQSLAALNYESAYQHFPPGYTANKEGKKLLSWRVHILPFIEQNNLYEQFKLDEPWDSPHNKRLIGQMPAVYKSPVSRAGNGMTVYRGIGGAWDSKDRLQGVLAGELGTKETPRVGFGSITDGSSNTIFVIETSDEMAVPWTMPEAIDPDNFELAKIFGNYADGTNMALCDGSIQFLSKSTPKKTIQHLMGRSDGNIVDLSRSRPSRRSESRRSSVDPDFKVDPRFTFGSTKSQEIKLEDLLTPDDQEVLAEQRLTDNLREIGLSLFNFESAYRAFPRVYTVNSKGKPLLSWRVLILPFIEEQELFSQFRMDEPWDSAHNLKLLDKMPEIFKTDPAIGAGKTAIVGNGGKQGLVTWPKGDRSRGLRGVMIGQCYDGTSNTLLLMDAGPEFAVEWTKPTEFEPSAEVIAKLLERKMNVVMGDGRPVTFKSGMSAELFKALLTRDGREDIDYDLLQKSTERR